MIQIRFYIRIAFTYPAVAGGTVSQRVSDDRIDNALYDVAGEDLELFTRLARDGTHLTVGPLQALERAEQVDAGLLATLVKHGCTVLEAV